MESVDIGGASKAGRPPIPPMTTVTEEGAPTSDPGSVIYKKAAEVYDNKDFDENADIPKRVAKSAEPGAKVAYPSSHPANNPELSLEAGGGIILGKGQSVAGPRIPLGDVRAGYVTGARGDLPEYGADEGTATEPAAQQPSYAAGAVQEPTMEEHEDNRALAELQREIKQAQEKEMNFVRTEAGTPLVEVLFNTPIGAIVSYYRRVEQFENKLILVSDNSQGDSQRFIPKPQMVDGKPAEMIVVITGKDKFSYKKTVIPLDINFTLDEYDFSVMLVKED